MKGRPYEIYAVQVAIDERCAVEVGSRKNSLIELGVAKRCAAEVRPRKVALFEVRVFEH
jgi:hypothetical protein